VPLNAETLATDLKTEIMTIHTQMEQGDGMTPDAYAQALATAIASKVVSHITANAQVNINSTLPVTAGLVCAAGPVTGAIPAILTGTVS
jgi:methylphosphotriester-DNA--protein-cysteine methyltransferase